MEKSLTLALYLATRARSDRAASRAHRHGGQDAERYGETSTPRPEGPLVWFHTGNDHNGSSVRELVYRMQAERRDLQVLLTTNAEERETSEPGVIWQYAPDESLPSVRRFLDHWRPNIGIWTEPDLRPALIAEAAGYGVPLYLIDAQTAMPDPQSWRWLRGMSASLMTRFRKVLTGNRETARALRSLGTSPDRIELCGFLEEGTPALPCDDSERDALAAALGARPVWLAAYVTPEECELVLSVHRRVQRRSHRLLLILAPDAPEDGRRCHELLVAEGSRSALRSDGEEPDGDTQVYIADTEGEMGLWYRLAQICFMGCSLAGQTSGANLYEPAALGSAIIHGPDTRNFRRAFDKLGQANATRMVRNADQLAGAVENLLAPDTAAHLAHEAWKVCSTGAEVTDRVIDMIFTELDEQEDA